jgi:hypothetical protein
MIFFVLKSEAKKKKKVRVKHHKTTYHYYGPGESPSYGGNGCGNGGCCGYKLPISNAYKFNFRWNAWISRRRPSSRMLSWRRQVHKITQILNYSF